MEPVTLEGKIIGLTVNDRRKELIFRVRTKEGDQDVLTTADYDDKYREESQAYVGETLTCTAVKQKSQYVASAWKLVFGPNISKTLAMHLFQVRKLITPRKFFDTLVAADATKVGTLELAPQSSADPNLFPAKDGQPPYAAVVGWLLARTKSLRGDALDIYHVLVDAEKVVNPTAARLARRKLYSKASEYAETLIPKFGYKMRVVQSGRLEDPKYPDALPPEIK